MLGQLRDRHLISMWYEPSGILHPGELLPCCKTDGDNLPAAGPAPEGGSSGARKPQSTKKAYEDRNMGEQVLAGLALHAEG